MNNFIFLIVCVVASLALNKINPSPGSSCPTSQVCATRVSCQYWLEREKLVKNLPRNNPQVQKYIRDARDGICNKAKRAVCCPIVPDPDPIECKMDCSKDSCNGLPDKDECGYVTVPPKNILGGEDAELGEFSFMALLGEPRSGKIIWKCGATLINKWWVVTAAHCISDDISQHLVRLGEHTVNENPDCLNNGFCMDKVQDISVKKAIVHPDYDPKLYNNVINDIALVMLSKPARIVEWEIGVTTVCLPIDDRNTARKLDVNNLKDDLVGKKLLVAGWGFTEFDPVGHPVYKGETNDSKAPSNILQKLKMPVLSNEDCGERWGQNNSMEQTKICAGGELNKDSCKGDSGSPLLASKFLPNGALTDDNSQQWFLMGIVSYGSSYCGKGKPAVHTRVQNFIPWIRKVIGNDKCSI